MLAQNLYTAYFSLEHTYLCSKGRNLYFGPHSEPSDSNQ